MLLRRHSFRIYGQLTREDNAALDKTYVYEYNGIKNVESYAYKILAAVENPAAAFCFDYYFHAFISKATVTSPRCAEVSVTVALPG